MKLSIRWKLILAITLPLLVVYGGFLAHLFQALRTKAYEKEGVFLQEYAYHSAAALNGEFAAVAEIARSTAAFLEVHGELSAPELDALLRANVRRSPLVYGSCLAFEPGAFPGRELYAPYVSRTPGAARGSAADVLRSIDIAADAYDYRTWEWYSKPKQQGGEVWTEPYFDEGAGNIVMTTCSVPVRRDGKVIGIATVDVELAGLQKLMQRGDIPGAVYTVLSRAGRFISHYLPDYIMKETVFTAPALKDKPNMREFAERLLSLDHGVELIQKFPLDEPSFLAHAVMPATGWRFVVAIPESQVMAPVFASLRDFALTALGSLALIVGIVLWVSFRITGPVRQLSAELQRIGDGQIDCCLDSRYPNDEIGRLAATFRDMVTKLRCYIDALTHETAERAKVESDLRVARHIQESLVPRTFPPFPERRELDLHALLRPARQVGGDFYDFFFVSPHELVIAIADVSGKGVPAALLMAVTRTLVRNHAGTELSPGRVLALVNHALARDNQDGYFVTAFLGYYHAGTGVVRYANAGHPPPLRLTPGGAVAELGEGTGPLLGIFEDADYGELEGRLEPGESLVLFTDGASEATSPADELYGDERLAAFVAGCGGRGAEQVCGELAAELDRFEQGNPADDLTLLVLRRVEA